MAQYNRNVVFTLQHQHYFGMNNDIRTDSSIPFLLLTSSLGYKTYRMFCISCAKFRLVLWGVMIKTYCIYACRNINRYDTMSILVYGTVLCQFLWTKFTLIPTSRKHRSLLSLLQDVKNCASEGPKLLWKVICLTWLKIGFLLNYLIETDVFLPCRNVTKSIT